MADITHSCPRCSICNIEAPQPLLICFKCSEGTDKNGEIIITGYCGSTCRDVDLGHQTTCLLNNDRKCLYRAGDLLQAVFFEWRETAFDLKLKSVWKANGILCFQEDDYGPGVAFYPFPKHLFQNLQDKQKMLSYFACTDISSNLLDLSRKLLQGLATEVYNMTMTIDPRRLTIHRYFQEAYDKRNPPHHVVQVILKGGESYILDPTGAQNGQFRAVVPSGKYMREQALECIQQNEHGYVASGIMANVPQDKYGVWKAYALMRDRLKAVIEEWEMSRSQTVGQLLRSNERRYREGRRDLLRTEQAALKKCIDEVKSWQS